MHLGKVWPPLGDTSLLCYLRASVTLPYIHMGTGAFVQQCVVLTLYTSVMSVFIGA